MIMETETETREKEAVRPHSAVIVTEPNSEKDDFKRLLFDLWLEQTEQMG